MRQMCFMPLRNFLSHFKSNSLISSLFSDFTFKTYAPLAFRYFLNLFGIKREDFLVSLCSKQMRELSNPGSYVCLHYFLSISALFVYLFTFFFY